MTSPGVYAKDNELENLSDYDYSKFKGKNITLNIANWENICLSMTTNI